MTASALHITIAQINPIVGNLAYNLEKIRKVVREAPANADLIVFPELALCGYPPEDLVLKSSFMDEIEDNLKTLADDSKHHRVHLIVPAPMRQGRTLYNAAHMIGGGVISATVKKHDLPNYGVFDEVRIFSPGPLPDPVPFKGHKLGIMVCEDMWKPDVARALKEKGADILIVPNASPYEIRKNEIRMAQASARAAETGLPLVYVNQVGGQDELVFDGASFVMNEQGKLIVQAEEFIEDIHHTSWEKTPTGRWLCLTDAVAPVHEGADAIYQAVMTGLRDYVYKNGFPGVLIGLSGGIDSALSAAIAVDALGPEKVHGVMMPSKYTAKDSTEDAEKLAKNLGIAIDSISIESAVAAFEKDLKPYLTKQSPGTVHENIQPRCRGLILMGLSNAGGKMVLSTGNKSETAVGYATLYGDMCGGFNVLKDIYKMQVYELSRWRNKHKPDHGLGPSGAVIPDRSITKVPTAELKPNQTDQDSLPPYPVLDAILEQLIEKDLGVAEVVDQGFDPEIVRKVWRLLETAEYKRRQAPPGVKITSRAFGRDRRYPITNHYKG